MILFFFKVSYFSTFLYWTWFTLIIKKNQHFFLMLMSASHDKYSQYRDLQNLLCHLVKRHWLSASSPLIWREAARRRAATSCVAEGAAPLEGILLNNGSLSPARNCFCWLCKRQAAACPWRGSALLCIYTISRANAWMLTVVDFTSYSRWASASMVKENHTSK